ncbi:DUF5988 family protein [Streptomyces sp. 6N223]|uniref:DUF5988 family protein n=1 Tax=Streptomyces sp. 6N223 TaxID=3457412 RepID=UPI003FD45AA3
MDKLSAAPVHDGMIDAILEGGPPDLPHRERIRRVSSGDRKVKVPHHGGYEHFELVDDSSDTTEYSPVLFRWTMRTKIAE